MFKTTFCLMLFLSAITSACGDGFRDDYTQGPFSYVNSLAAYVRFPEGVQNTVDVVDAVTKAREGEASTPAGFIPGLWSAGAARNSETGRYGFELIFLANSTASQRAVLDVRVAEAGYEVVWIGLDDEWPHCAGTKECETPAAAIDRID